MTSPPSGRKLQINILMNEFRDRDLLEPKAKTGVLYKRRKQRPVSAPYHGDAQACEQRLEVGVVRGRIICLKKEEPVKLG